MKQRDRAVIAAGLTEFQEENDDLLTEAIASEKADVPFDSWIHEEPDDSFVEEHKLQKGS